MANTKQRRAAKSENQARRQLNRGRHVQNVENRRLLLIERAEFISRVEKKWAAGGYGNIQEVWTEWKRMP